MAPKKSTAAAKTDATPVVEPVVPTDTESTEAVVPTTVPDEETPKDRFLEVLDTLHGLQNTLKDVIVTVKSLRSEHSKLQKQKGKKAPRKQPVTTDGVPPPKRQPSGFAKPAKLSDVLCTFLDVPAETLMARTEVTKLINKYIKEHNLQDETDKRRIIPDEKLNTILTIKSDKPLSFFSLQSAIKSHFEKVEEATPP